MSTIVSTSTAAPGLCGTRVGQLERLVATLALDDVEAADRLLRLGERAVCDERLLARSHDDGVVAQRLAEHVRASLAQHRRERDVLADDRASLVRGQRGLRLAVAVDQEQESHRSSSVFRMRRRRSGAFDSNSAGRDAGRVVRLVRLHDLVLRIDRDEPLDRRTRVTFRVTDAPAARPAKVNVPTPWTVTTKTPAAAVPRFVIVKLVPVTRADDEVGLRERRDRHGEAPAARVPARVAGGAGDRRRADGEGRRRTRASSSGTTAPSTRSVGRRRVGHRRALRARRLHACGSPGASARAPSCRPR